jgi:dihydrofolate reductase
VAERPKSPNRSHNRARPYRIEGYAIVSSDGMIADAAAAFPSALIFDADKKYYERELDRVDAVIQGRNSHESQSNSPRRRRLVLTRRTAALAPDPEHPHSFLWNPAGATLDDACAALGLATGTLGIVGGTQVFDLFLDIGYDVFHLSRADNVKLPGGPPVFSQVRPGRSPEDLLAQAGLEPGPRQILDEANRVSLVNWTRKPAA